METKYFKRRWEETRGDEFDSWGFSTWFFETNLFGIPQKQIELYDNGKILRYDSMNPYDEYGQLGEKELDLEEFKEFEITKEAFEQIWNH